MSSFGEEEEKFPISSGCTTSYVMLRIKSVWREWEGPGRVFLTLSVSEKTEITAILILFICLLYIV